MYKNCLAVLKASGPSRAGAIALSVAAQQEAARVIAAPFPSAQRQRRRWARLRESLSPLDVDTTATEKQFVPSSCDLGWMQARAEAQNVHLTPQNVRDETEFYALVDAGADLVVIDGEDVPDSAYPDAVPPLTGLCSRLVRRCRKDVWIAKGAAPDVDAKGQKEPRPIIVCIDGSDQSYAGLCTGLRLSQRLGCAVEAVGVYDPYLHYTLFNGIVNVLSAEASKVFKFEDQEKLHEEIIDTGLAKIYQAHLEVARRVADELGVPLRITLLDGKALQKICQYVQQRDPSLLILGRIGVHAGGDRGGGDMDIGATAESVLRTVRCDVLLVSRTHKPRVDLVAEESVEWLPEAQKKMQRVPDFVRGVATTAILRWAVERGHSVITTGVINAAMGDLLPPDAAQAMGYVAEEVAINADQLAVGITFICPTCGHAVKDLRPQICVVCREAGSAFERIDRTALERLGTVERGALSQEAAFDGVQLTWTSAAKELLRRVPSGYQRRRTKARIEKTARVRGLSLIDDVFACDMIEQELAETAYLSPRGESLQVDIDKERAHDDTLPKARHESALTWTDAAWKRLSRVPEGFMREMTQKRIEAFCGGQHVTAIDFALCEKGIAEGRRMMAEALSQGKIEEMVSRGCKAFDTPTTTAAEAAPDPS